MSGIIRRIAVLGAAAALLASPVAAAMAASADSPTAAEAAGTSAGASPTGSVPTPAERERATRATAARLAAENIVDVPVTFTVRNTNRSKTGCRTDGATHRVRGHLTAPASVLSGEKRAITLYQHGIAAGEWYWRLDVPGYHYAEELAKRGHASLTLDRLGYGSSDRPDGLGTCIGAEADIAHQIVGQLRKGSYALGSTAGEKADASGVSGASDEKAGASDEKAGASDEKAGASDKKAGASDEKAGASDEKAGASDKKGGASDKKGDKGSGSAPGLDSPVTFDTVTLAGQSNGGQVVQIEAYSFGGIDGLMIMDWTDRGLTPEANTRFFSALQSCMAGGQPSRKASDPSGYVYYDLGPDQFRRGNFHDTEQRVMDAATPHQNRHPCGDMTSQLDSVFTDLEHLKSIKVPVLLVYGDDDARVTGGAAHRRLFTGAETELIDIPGAGHYATMARSAPRTFDQIDAWLDARGL
nr:hypothetical protein OH820_16700 [Streptomyces sp. NBC_00857]